MGVRRALFAAVTTPAYNQPYVFMGWRAKVICVNSDSNALPDAASKTSVPIPFNAIKSVTQTKIVCLLEIAAAMDTALRALYAREIKHPGTTVILIANAWQSFVIYKINLHMINIIWDTGVTANKIIQNML